MPDVQQSSFESVPQEPQPEIETVTEIVVEPDTPEVNLWCIQGEGPLVEPRVSMERTTYPTTKKRPPLEKLHWSHSLRLEINSHDREALIAEGEYLSEYFGKEFSVDVHRNNMYGFYTWGMTLDPDITPKDYYLSRQVKDTQQVKDLESIPQKELPPTPAVSPPMTSNDDLMALAEKYGLDLGENDIVEPPKERTGWELRKLSSMVGYIQGSGSNPMSCYIGGDNEAIIAGWGEFICGENKIGERFELRYAKRMKPYNYEIKIWGLSLNQLKAISERNLRKYPPKRELKNYKGFVERIRAA